MTNRVTQLFDPNSLSRTLPRPIGSFENGPTPKPILGKDSNSAHSAELQPTRLQKRNAVMAVRNKKKRGDMSRKYKELYYLSDRGVSVAVSKLNRRVHVRKFDLGTDTLAKFTIGCNLDSETNIVEVLDLFESSSHQCVVFEEMQISLHNVVQSTSYPTDSELVAILAQILDGLVFLAKHGLGHGSLNCHNIHASPHGKVKLAHQDGFQSLTPDISKSDVRAVGEIAILLMQKDKGPIKDERRWQNVHNFIQNTAALDSAAELREDGIFNHSWTKESLIGLFAMAELNVRRKIKLIDRDLE